MYYSGDISKFYLGNWAIIGKRESGKTTILKNIVSDAMSKGYTVLLFDTVTDHPSKSLLINCTQVYDEFLIINSPSVKEIQFSNISSFLYPYNIVKDAYYSLFLFDISKYLEEGYKTNNLIAREKIREYYKRLFIQELYVMLDLISSKKCIVVCDEVEFLSETKNIIKRYNNSNINFVVSLHNKESLSTSKDLFNILELGDLFYEKA